MKPLMKHVERTAVFTCAWENEARGWNTDKANIMYSNIFVSPDTHSKYINQEGLRIRLGSIN